MAVPTYIDDVSATLISETPGTVDFRALDSLTQVWEMRQSETSAFIAARRQHETPTESISLSPSQYVGLYLKSISVSGGGSPFSEVSLLYEGFIVARGTTQNYVDRNDSITEAVSTLPTDTGESVTCSYYTQMTSYRWFSSSQPARPRFALTVPTEVQVQQIFDFSPAKYTGDLQYKYVGRLSQFDRTEVAPGKWAVIETWTRRIEADA